jgi:hypothetical protein
MFLWRISPDRASDIERLERRVAAIEARLGLLRDDNEPGTHRLEAALASLQRVIERRVHRGDDAAGRSAVKSRRATGESSRWRGSRM